MADWGADTLPFSMEFMVRFERAVVTMDRQGFNIFAKDKVLKPELEKGDAYYNEILDFIRCINENQQIKICPPESSMLSLKIALAEKESASAGGVVSIG
jgi:predicted dehydrogenase